MNLSSIPLPSFDSALLGFAALSMAVWLYLLVGRGRFWLGDQRLPQDTQTFSLPRQLPTVVVVVPARNEVDVIERTLCSLLEQDYPGTFHVVLVDDQSEDGTGDLARKLVTQHPGGAGLTVVTAGIRPHGWIGKVWALHTGLQVAEKQWPAADYLYLTDADIVHSKGNLRELVAKAESEQLALVSLMVRLHCHTFWERLLIPTFVYFFQQVYPFPRVNDPNSPVGGAAGGCMLVKTHALKQTGGMPAIRHEVIDDCALGARIKRTGKIWVGLTESEHSIRPYRGLADIWAMVTRTAYTQLRYSPWILGQTVIGLILVYVVPPLITLTWAFHGNDPAGGLAVLAWLTMMVTFYPTLRIYSLPFSFGVVLSAAAMFYMGMTVDSARRHWQGLGVQWKGRTAYGQKTHPALRYPKSMKS